MSDFPFLLSWVQKLNIQNEWILDIACGTGRVTIPFIENGYQMIGIDIHEGMLAEAKSKSASLKNIKWLQQDCLQLSVEETIPLAYMVGHGFQHFLTNIHQNQLLTSIHNALAENGIFILDTRFPSKEELMQPSTEEYWTTITDEKGRRCDLYTELNYDSIQQIQHYITTRRFYEDNTLVEELKTTIDLRYTYPQELERLLVENGFELLHIYNDWDGNELQEDCYSMVVVCRKKR
ncbi:MULTISPECIES: class I SAM-dependent methyltransferase [Bacillus]|uniref:class I SAM-dependent methyltransferase n=1 Tax=Bacillus TaxID=1386 RepID=UPI000678A106|nr:MULTISPECIES: class I SAM-dependent methyltransferase [Bacillus]QWI72379.1 class I SAM-dependent methyltransferase [Bacillus mycoides]UYO22404.1 class I SAM-dependent methyltransferase [Bacillus sp. 41-22]HDR7567676.1 class I SAM-dependent methyltransferase [Bacillus mycoides]HDR7618620.1 class I SAM-dependent methyltransferase [Bacillus mycoides]